MSNCRARQCAKEEVLKILFLAPLPFHLSEKEYEIFLVNISATGGFHRRN